MLAVLVVGRGEDGLTLVCTGDILNSKLTISLEHICTWNIHFLMDSLKNVEKMNIAGEKKVEENEKIAKYF